MPVDTTDRVAIRPDPDPTDRTQQQIDRLENLSKEARAQLEEKIEVRFAGYDKAIELLQKLSDRQPPTSEVAQAIVALKELHAERFNTVAMQFKERDARMGQGTHDAKTAVDAALAAAKEAVTKTEISFTKQIDQLSTLIYTMRDNLSEKGEASRRALDGAIDDLKTRLNQIEGRSSGVGFSASVIAAIISSAGVLVAIGVVFLRK